MVLLTSSDRAAASRAANRRWAPLCRCSSPRRTSAPWWCRCSAGWHCSGSSPSPQRRRRCSVRQTHRRHRCRQWNRWSPRRVSPPAGRLSCAPASIRPAPGRSAPAPCRSRESESSGRWSTAGADAAAPPTPTGSRCRWSRARPSAVLSGSGCWWMGQRRKRRRRRRWHNYNWQLTENSLQAQSTGEEPVWADGVGHALCLITSAAVAGGNVQGRGYHLFRHFNCHWRRRRRRKSGNASVCSSVVTRIGQILLLLLLLWLLPAHLQTAARRAAVRSALYGHRQIRSARGAVGDVLRILRIKMWWV